MKITLKAKSLSLTEFHKKIFGGKGILLPLNMNLSNKKLNKLYFVLDEDFHGIKKNVSLSWTYLLHPYKDKWITCIAIPLRHNITT